MSETVQFKISIPPDSDGFVLLQCEHCGEFFKCKPSDAEDDEVLNIYCPSCGLTSEDYFTDDVHELAETIAENYANECMYNALKDFERIFSSNKFISFKAGKKPKQKNESPIRALIDDMRIEYYSCCKRYAKINPLLKMSASYCPFCGVIKYADE